MIADQKEVEADLVAVLSAQVTKAWNEYKRNRSGKTDDVPAAIFTAGYIAAISHVVDKMVPMEPKQ